MPISRSLTSTLITVGVIVLSFTLLTARLGANGQAKNKVPGSGTNNSAHTPSLPGNFISNNSYRLDLFSNVESVFDWKSGKVGSNVINSIGHLPGFRTIAPSLRTSSEYTRGVNYICKGDPLPVGYVITGVGPGLQFCGPSAAYMPIEKARTGSVVCGQVDPNKYPYFSALQDYVIYNHNEFVVSEEVFSSGCPGNRGWRLDALDGEAIQCVYSVIGTQQIGKFGYLITEYEKDITSKCLYKIKLEIPTSSQVRIATPCDNELARFDSIELAKRVCCYELTPPTSSVCEDFRTVARTCDAPAAHPSYTDVSAKGAALPNDFGSSEFRPEAYIGNGSALPMPLVGDRTKCSGTAANSGPSYEVYPEYPYVMRDINGNVVLLHPGAEGNPQIGAAIAYTVPKDGDYLIEGAFARANNFKGAGDGVEVAIFKNGGDDLALYRQAISSAHAVNLNNYFDGSGVAPFRLIQRLTKNDVLRFVVFTGVAKIDGGFDVTALKLTVDLCDVPVVKKHPIDQTVFLNQVATFTSGAGKDSSSVQWQVSADGQTFSDIQGATSLKLSVTATLAQNGNRYRAVFNNDCGTATTDAATLTVLPPN